MDVGNRGKIGEKMGNGATYGRERARVINDQREELDGCRRVGGEVWGEEGWEIDLLFGVLGR